MPGLYLDILKTEKILQFWAKYSRHAWHVIPAQKSCTRQVNTRVSIVDLRLVAALCPGEMKMVNATEMRRLAEFSMSYLNVRCELALDNWKILSGDCSRNNHAGWELLSKNDRSQDNVASS